MLGELIIWLCIATPVLYITLNLNWKAVKRWISL